MRYIGSKRTVLPFIKTTIEETYGNISNAIVADLFAGTACVGEMFKREGARVLSNDYLSFSYALQIEKIKLNGIPESKRSYLDLISLLNAAPGKEGFFFREYSIEGSSHGEYTRNYFSKDNAMKIDGVRTQIELLRVNGEISEDKYLEVQGKRVHQKSATPFQFRIRNWKGTIQTSKGLQKWIK